MFDDLLHLPRRSLALSSFTLEDDAIVRPSAYLEDLDALTLATAPVGPAPRRTRGAVRAGGRARCRSTPRRTPAGPARWRAGGHAGRAGATVGPRPADRLRGDRARSLPLVPVQVLRARRARPRGRRRRGDGVVGAGARHARPRGVPDVLRRVDRGAGTAPSTPRRCRRRARCSRRSSIACCRPFRRRSGRSSGPCCSAPPSPRASASAPSASRRRRPQALVARELEVKLDGEYTLGPGAPADPAARHRRSHRPARRRHAAADRLQDRQGEQRARAAAGEDLRRLRRDAPARASRARRGRSATPATWRSAAATTCSPRCSRPRRGPRSWRRPAPRRSRSPTRSRPARSRSLPTICSPATSAASRRCAARTTSVTNRPQPGLFDFDDGAGARAPTPRHRQARSRPTRRRAPTPSIRATTWCSRRRPAPARRRCWCSATSTC